MPRFAQSTWHRLPATPPVRPATVCPFRTLPTQSVSSAVVIGSSPDAQCRSEQSAPNHSGSCVAPLASDTVHDESHTQPKILSSSHVATASLPPYVNAGDSMSTGCALFSLAICAMLTHLPWPEHSFGHAERWQASPSYPVKHLHLPVVRSQMPAFEHSASACAVLVAVAASAHAFPDGHTRFEQSGARYVVTSDDDPHPS
mmetsp:Transcript_6406/g.22860  ORF Transcript_6406/g.22860 Transcript_6406/m.22860 type:complete len:201 (-) Transcript_6406:321-923(-)